MVRYPKFPRALKLFVVHTSLKFVGRSKGIDNDIVNHSLL